MLSFFDLLWIFFTPCCTACFMANLQQLELCGVWRLVVVVVVVVVL